MEFHYDVFLSHNSKDKPKVRRLAERLKQAGLRVWFDEWNIRPGEIIALKVDEGLEQSRVLVLCISGNALASGWVALERSTVIHRDPSNEQRRFIPLWLEECELPDSLRRYKYLDYRDEADAAFSELLIACLPDRPETLVAQTLPTVQEIKREDTGKAKPKGTKKPAEKRGKTLSVEQVLEFEAHDTWINTISVSRDGTWFATGSSGNDIGLWDIDSGKKKGTLSGQKKEVTAVLINRDGTSLFSTGWDMAILQWDLVKGGKPLVRRGHHHNVLDLALSADGATLFSCSANEGPPTWRAWDVANPKVFRTFKDEGNTVINSIAASPAGSRLITGGADATLKVWDAATGECQARLKGHSGNINCVRFTSDGNKAVSSADDNTIKIWDLSAMTCLATLEGHKKGVHAVAISQDDELIASAGFIDGTVRLWSLQSGACLHIIEPKYHSPLCVEFTPDGERLIIGDASGDISIYRITKQKIEALLEPPRRYVNAKIVLLGEGSVGKTSLAHRLIDDQYVIQDRTHGMNVWRLELPLQQDVELEREALLWDLAGQEDYRLIHQLFLDETALALLLINPQKNDPFSEAGDWLKALKTAAQNHEFGREAKRLLVFSQIDVGGMKLSDEKIGRFVQQYSFEHWLPTSAKTGENCSDGGNQGRPSKLKALIAESIPWRSLPWTSTPRLLAELKSAVIAMRDEKDIRLLRFSELSQRLEQALPGERFGDSEVRTAVTLLANHGLVRPFKFGDLVLLQPELLNSYAGAIIRAARKHTDQIGCVREVDIYDAGFDFTGVQRLKHSADEQLLLRAMVQTFLDHALCIAEDAGNGRQLVFPSQYRREKDLPRDPEVFVSYTFSGEWQTIWTTLVVRLWYSEEFEKKELWRNAAEFASAKGHKLGLKIDNRQGQGAATISLYFDHEVPDELRVIFIEYVYRHLAKYGCELTRDRRYVCPNCKRPVKDLDAVRERLASGRTLIPCQGCDQQVPLVDVIEERLGKDRVARKVHAMDQTATRALDTQALEQILIGHMMAVTGEANQIFRPTTMFDHGIDGEVEFKDDDGKASGKRIYVQLKSGNSYLRERKRDGTEVFDAKDERHLQYWVSQPVDVYLVIRQTDEVTREQTIRWMNVTAYLKARKNKTSKQIVFEGEKLDVNAIWQVRDGFFPKQQTRRK